MDPDLLSTLISVQALDHLEDASFATLARQVASESIAEIEIENPVRLVRFGYLFESEAVREYRDAEFDDPAEYRDSFDRAFTCWSSLVALAGDLASAEDPGPAALASEFPVDFLEPDTALAFHLAVCGLASQRTADVRLRLRKFRLVADPEGRWDRVVAGQVASAVALLTRKGSGWDDVDAALRSIEDLRSWQADHEGTHLGSLGDADEDVAEAFKLLGFYHLAHMVTIVGAYLQDGATEAQGVRLELDRHRLAAEQAFAHGGWRLEQQFGDLVWVACKQLADNSIWTHAGGLGDSARRLVRLLTERGRPAPVIELWPGQQKALKSNLLDPYRRAVIVEMPTSAGKTLLAKFAIMQTLALNPGSTVAYIVPTRALVNQVTRDLRSDIGALGLKVEQAVPAYELDPIEDSLLSDEPDVIVTTAEKLDFLLRGGHRSLADLSLIVADEAHGLGDGHRGARLELLLATIRRERPGARFLLLSPFLPNDDELVTWLGQDRALPPIKVDWRPAKRIVGALDTAGRLANRRTHLETLPAAMSPEMREGVRIPLGPPTARTISALSSNAAASASNDGGVLVLCRGRGTAATRASEIAAMLPKRPPSALRTAVERYAATELGASCDLVELLGRGVAYHHSGLPQELRWLIETLIKTQEVKVVTGTTTLAQGVNFPIRTVIIETLTKGNVPLTYSDFWNIAGRAGRALLDEVGIVMFPTGSRQRHQDFSEFLEGEAEAVASQLATLIARSDEIADTFSLAQIREMPELSSFLQFLAHAMRVSGSSAMADEAEDLLRSSLVYHQARRRGHSEAEQLVRLARSYLTRVAGNQILPMADKTGFSTPSVAWLLAQRNEYPTLARKDAWTPSVLFGDDLVPLTERVAAVGDVPEIHLSDGVGGRFDAERVAAIVRDWVRGRSLSSMSTAYSPRAGSASQQLSEFSRYLFSTVIPQASWGLGALEAMALDGRDSAGSDDQRSYVPSMVYFGVNSPEAVWLRMVGVPRFAAGGLSDLWRADDLPAPQSHEQIRGWVSALDDRELEVALGPESHLTADDMRLLWGELSA